MLGRAIAIGGIALAAACGSSDPATDGPMQIDGPPRSDGPDSPLDGPGDTPDAPFDATGAACATVLLYGDCDPALANCLSIAPGLRMTSDDAATRLGLAQLDGGIHDQAAFRALYDAGGFELIVFESSSYDI